MDLPSSIRPDNAIPMIFAGLKNMPLTKYLIEQVRQTPEERHAALREYIPFTKLTDWELKEAGQRVQVIKKDKEKGGVLEFGTEVVVSKDGTVAALLGASPGASTAAAVMLDLITRCFGVEGKAEKWQTKLKEMVPSFGVSLSENEGQLETTRKRTAEILQLKKA